MRWSVVLLAFALVPAGALAAPGAGPGGDGEDDDRGPPEEAPRQGRGPPTWRPSASPAPGSELPLSVEGRYVAFELTAEGVRNLTVHGRHVGNVSVAVGPVEEYRRDGNRLSIEAGDVEIEVHDVPRVRMRVDGDGLTSDAPAAITLASGATLEVRVEDDRFELEASPPRGSLGRGPPTALAPADIEPSRGPNLGLRASAHQRALDVSAPRPDTLNARFEGVFNGTAGGIAVDLGLTRALLVEDLDGDGRVSIGEPALANASLENGTASVTGSHVTLRFPLWSGNLTLTAELDSERVKVTYTVEDLAAPPGTLFVLESVVDAPPGTVLVPTPRGVQATNGSLSARWDVGGPVSVDGEEAWARHSVLVHDDGRVFVLLMYPAGDALVHDPTLTVQSAGQALSNVIGASPYAVLAGALLAAVAVGVTFYARRPR